MTVAVCGTFAQSPLSFFARTGIGTSCFWKENVESETRIAWKVGAGAEYSLNRTWSVRAALDFVSKGGKEQIQHVGKAHVNALYLEIPLQLTARLDLGGQRYATLGAGPYIACGVGGKTNGDFTEYYAPDSSFQPAGHRFRLDTFGSIASGNMGGRRFDAGLSARIGMEYHRFLFGAEAQVGFLTMNRELASYVSEIEQQGWKLPKNLAMFFTVGYRFRLF